MVDWRINWRVLGLLLFVAVHRHLFDVYLPFYDDTVGRFSLSVSDVQLCLCISQRKRHCRLRTQVFFVFAISYGRLSEKESRAK